MAEYYFILILKLSTRILTVTTSSQAFNRPHLICFIVVFDLATEVALCCRCFRMLQKSPLSFNWNIHSTNKLLILCPGALITAEDNWHVFWLNGKTQRMLQVGSCSAALNFCYLRYKLGYDRHLPLFKLLYLHLTFTLTVLFWLNPPCHSQADLQDWMNGNVLYTPDCEFTMTFPLSFSSHDIFFIGCLKDWTMHLELGFVKTSDFDNY